MPERLTDKYVIDDARCLGRGGMGEVFAGQIIGLHGVSHPVAIKRIRAEHTAEERYRSMFVTEARLAARLSHTNLVTVFDLDHDAAGRLFLVMELVDGLDLADLLRKGALPIPVALFVAGEILRGLGHAHTFPRPEDEVRGLVHRDVSPTNVLIGWDGAVKVSDFGLAKAREATDASASLSIRGKAAYLSPEQANGGPIDGRSDLFSVGVMLWEMLCGGRLFGSDNLTATLKRALIDPIPPPRFQRPEVPDDVTHATMRLLERDRAHRYPNAASALLALSTCADYPRTGRELLASLLDERMSEQARQRRTERARPSPPPPIFARPAADRPGGERTPLVAPPADAARPRSADETTLVRGPRSEPLRALAGAWQITPPRRSRARSLALIGVALLSATVTVFVAARARDVGRDARSTPAAGDARSAPAVPTERPGEPRPKSPERTFSPPVSPAPRAPPTFPEPTAPIPRSIPSSATVRAAAPERAPAAVPTAREHPRPAARPPMNPPFRFRVIDQTGAGEDSWRQP